MSGAGSSPEISIYDITNLAQLKNLLLPGMYKFGNEDRLAEGATYPKIFMRRPTQLATQQSMHMRMIPPLPADPANISQAQQHFVYSCTAKERNLLFALVPDSDPRAVGVKEASFVHDIDNLSKLKPVRASEFANAMVKMLSINREAREEDAAAIFNKANIYDPTIGGDGVAMCSTDHPHDGGMWANTFQTQHDLNATALEAAVEIVKQMKDDRGNKLYVKPTTLLVPRQLAAVGLAVVAQSPSVHDLIVWDCLEHKSWWFLLNDCGGLIHFLRCPFEVDIWADRMTDMLLIKSRTRDCFTHVDPRAVFASMPTA